MNLFSEVLAYLDEKVYKPNQLKLESIREEKQNSKYGAGTFKLASRTVRFRVAKKTPTKNGQFVAFWEKDKNNKNQPFSYEETPELLVIVTSMREDNFGQFVFPKEILLKHNILESSSTKGKMGIRVYPSWDKPTSKQAIKTQAWQLPYFIDMSNSDKLPINRMKILYFL